MRNEIRASRKFGNNEPYPERRELGVLDPRSNVVRNAPRYIPGQLPKVYEDYMDDAIAEFGGDSAAYAVAFPALMCVSLHATVKYNVRLSRPDAFKPPNDHCAILGDSGDNKSGMLKDFDRLVKGWQQQLPPRKRGQPRPVKALTQTGSVEGILKQIAANNGERLGVFNEEGMGLLRGGGVHHRDNANAMVSDLITRTWDASAYGRELTDDTKSFYIEQCLATLILSMVFSDFANWSGVAELIPKGALGRVSIATISNKAPKDRKRRIVGAEARMKAVMDKLHALRHVHFVMTPEADAYWDGWVDKKETANEELRLRGDAPGLVEWARKYDARILSQASVLAAIDLVQGTVKSRDGEQVPPPSGDEREKKIDSKPQRVRVVDIDLPTLKRAINFIEGFVFDTQRVVYERLHSSSEFGEELMNFMAQHILNADPEDHTYRDLSRNDLTYNGPKRLRGAVTDNLKVAHKRWIRALLDHGWIEVWDKPGARPLKRQRDEDDMAWYRVRLEFHEFFDSDANRAWARERLAKWGRAGGDDAPAQGVLAT